MEKMQDGQLSFQTVQDILDRAEQLADWDARGGVELLGNWTPGQCFQHIGRLIEYSYDGFPFRYPWHLRWISRIISMISWKLLLKLSMRPGFTNPKVARALEPDEQVSTEDGLQYLRKQINRIALGEQMLQPSPAEGKISHEQWVAVHLRHAEVHLSFQGERAIPS